MTTLDIDFSVPEPLRQAEGEALWRNASRMNKTPGHPNTYSITLTPDAPGHLEHLIGDAMGYIRGSLPNIEPDDIRMVAVRVDVDDL